MGTLWATGICSIRALWVSFSRALRSTGIRALRQRSATDNVCRATRGHSFLFNKFLAHTLCCAVKRPPRDGLQGFAFEAPSRISAESVSSFKTCWKNLSGPSLPAMAAGLKQTATVFYGCPGCIFRYRFVIALAYFSEAPSFRVLH